jgi:hypothetical protein
VDDIVTRHGSSFLCLKANTDREPPNRNWARIAAAGKDGKDGETIAVRGPRGLPGTTTVVSGAGTPTAFIADANIDAGQALIVSTAGHCDLASASGIATAAVVGLCVTDVASGLAGIMQTGDVLTLDDWSDATGSATLSPGSAYYAAETPRQLTTTPPEGAGKCVTFIGRALSETSLAVEVAAPILLSGATEDVYPLEAVFDSAADIGNALYISSDGHVDLASMDNPGVAGLSVESVSADATGHYVTEGQVTREDWTPVTGSASLSAGSLYYLDATSPGLLTATPPEDVGDSIVVIGRALTSTTLDVSIQPPMLLN